jgi:O-antigen biosynthesis alpha-1,2-mannosyltransferase
MMHRICVDDRWASAHGISRYSRELLMRLESTFEMRKIAQNCSISDPLSPWKLSAEIRHCGADVFWSPGFVPPANCPVPYVLTLHDLTHIRARGRLRAAYFNLLVRPMSRAAQKIVTVSEFSRAEICEWAGLSPERVVLVPNGVSSNYIPNGPFHLPGYPYLFYVGNHMPHKNLRRILTAFAVSGLAKDLFFLLTGDADSGLSELVISLGIQNRVVFTGVVAEADLPAYYRGASAVVLVSTSEGFGLPVVEAMACGTPVLAARATSLPEVAGGAALLVDPYNIEEIADGMRRIVTEGTLRDSCRAKGLQQSSRFNWDQSAQILSAILVEAAAGK